MASTYDQMSLNATPALVFQQKLESLKIGDFYQFTVFSSKIMMAVLRTLNCLPYFGSKEFIYYVVKFQTVSIFYFPLLTWLLISKSEMLMYNI